MGVCNSNKSERRVRRVSESWFSAPPGMDMCAVPENEKKITSEYQLMPEVIGMGAFSEVRRAVHLSSGQERAVKIVYKMQLNEKDETRIMKEVTILRQLDHPNIVKVYEYFKDAKFIYIVMELVSGGELFTRIQALNHFTERKAGEIFMQVMAAINYLHKKDIVHRDIKAENIMLDDNDVVKIIDFGTARACGKNQKMTINRSNPYYVAPEVIAGKYDRKCDIWSCGVLLYILLTGLPPFKGRNENEIMEAISSHKLPTEAKEFKDLSEPAKDLIMKMLEPNPKKRLSALEVLQHPWLTGSMNLSMTDRHLQVLQNIKNFEIKNNLQRAIYFFMINNVATKSDKQELTDLFMMLDVDKDGMISMEELNHAFKNSNLTGLNTAELQLIMDRIDANHTKKIDYTEFVAAGINRRALMSSDKIKTAFDFFDKDKSGTISVSEFSEILKRVNGLNDNAIQNLIAQFDADQNNKIDFKEFEKILTSIINT